MGVCQQPSAQYNERIRMSLYDYQQSREIEKQGNPFYSVLMCAMRQADSSNLVLLQSAFPEVWNELKARYNAVGGVLPGENIPALKCGVCLKEDAKLHPMEHKIAGSFSDYICDACERNMEDDE